MSASFSDILKQVSECSTKVVSVAAAQDEPVREAVAEARKQGIAEPILVGDKAKIFFSHKEKLEKAARK